MKSKEEVKAEQLELKRKAVVAKANQLVQKSRYSLSLTEQRIVLYALSKIKPTDMYLTELKFDIAEFFELCNLDNHNYQYLKDTLQKLKSKTFWIVIDDKGTESCVSWFGTVRMNKHSGIVTLKFDEDLKPFILQLRQQFTTYSIFPTLVMKSRYSVRLYELLKSYSNLNEWWFGVDEFRKRIDAEAYQKWTDLKRFVIDVAVTEINKYTDLSIDWDSEKEGRKYTRIHFYIVGKSPYYQLLADQSINDELDGQTNLLIP